MTKAGKVDTGAAPIDPDELGWFIDDSILKAVLAAHADARFDPTPRPARGGARVLFFLFLVAALVLHGLLLTLFLMRDSAQTVVATQETPVEVVVEPPKPPEPVKPPEPPKPPEKKAEPPKPKEDLRPSTSAPRAPTDTPVKTETKEEKTAAPNRSNEAVKGEAKPAPEPPASPEKETPANAPKSEATPDEPKPEKNATKPDDQTKPAAEPLDKAVQKKTAKSAKAKEAKSAKAAPKHKAVPNALAALASAPTLDSAMSFAKPTPKTKIYGGTDDVRWMSEVEAMLEAKVGTLPSRDHYQSGGKVAICFHVDENGRVIAREYCAKSGYPEIDQMAMQALLSAAPFPPPPPGLERGLIWVTTFDGRLPKLHFR